MLTKTKCIAKHALLTFTHLHNSQFIILVLINCLFRFVRSAAPVCLSASSRYFNHRLKYLLHNTQQSCLHRNNIFKITYSEITYSKSHIQNHIFKI